jgi:hypothetical protein
MILLKNLLYLIFFLLTHDSISYIALVLLHGNDIRGSIVIIGILNEPIYMYHLNESLIK